MGGQQNKDFPLYDIRPAGRGCGTQSFRDKHRSASNGAPPPKRGQADQPIDNSKRLVHAELLRTQILRSPRVSSCGCELMRYGCMDSARVGISIAIAGVSRTPRSSPRVAVSSNTSRRIGARLLVTPLVLIRDLSGRLAGAFDARQTRRAITGQPAFPGSANAIVDQAVSGWRVHKSCAVNQKI
jgi:hypothetical protein